MNLSLYLTMQQVVMGALMALGCHLVLGNIPKELKGSHIDVSGRIMGLALMVIPSASFIYYFSDMRYAGPQYATAINLSAYCLTSTLIALAYYLLLDHTQNKAIIRAHIAVGVLYPLPLWLGLNCGYEAISSRILTVSYTMFFVLAVTHISTCIYFYLQKLKSCGANMTTRQNLELKLVGRTIYVSCGLIIVSLLAPSFYSYPLWLGGVFVTLFIVGAIYIYICYHKILSNSISSLIQMELEISDMLDDEDELDESDAIVGLSEDVKQNIERHLNDWLKKREFVQHGISINYVAKAIYTNRTYLSRYINSVYLCSFKVWITRLRIEETKMQMRCNPAISIEDIAKDSGFASVESFSHIFARYEQQSPTKWRENIS